jgi:nucleoside phosphorylase
METSAMYTLGKVRRVDVCNLLVVSDELLHEWKPAFGTPELDDANTKAQQVILRMIEKNDLSRI